MLCVFFFMDAHFKLQERRLAERRHLQCRAWTDMISEVFHVTWREVRFSNVTVTC